MIKVKEEYIEYLDSNVYKELNSRSFLTCPFKQRVVSIEDIYCVESCMMFRKDRKFNGECNLPGFYILCSNSAQNVIRAEIEESEEDFKKSNR